MDESLKEAIATSVAAALKKAPDGLTDNELLEAVDDCESLADLRRVLVFGFLDQLKAMAA